MLRSSTGRVWVHFDQDHTESMRENKDIVTAKILWQVHVGLVFVSREEEF